MRALFACFALTLFAPSLAEAADPINAIVGDASWRDRPDDAGQRERIRVHLAFVLQLLRARPPEGLDAGQLERRHRALDALEAYRRAGVFPRRTGDPYAGRRPRFIDDRGVHCAVGEMIRATGHALLAARIDRRFEYAYVEQIEQPGLAKWATDHGFTTKELAMVQPGYDPPPNDALIEREVEEAKERITLQCAREHEPASSFRLRVRYRPYDDVRFRSMRWFDDFVQCFLEKARETIRIGGGAYDQELHRVRTWMRVHVEAPQAILERRLAAMTFGPDNTPCFPRPGAVPERVAVRVRIGAEGMRIEATTSPSNEAVAGCLESYVGERLGDLFGPGRWRLDARVEQEVGPRVNSEWLQRSVDGYAPGIATECWSEGQPERVRVTVRAERDADDFVIETEGGGEPFAACFRPKLLERLHGQLRTYRETSEGREPYFRIDGDAIAEGELEVETPTAREERIQRQREEMERRMQEPHF